MHYWQKALKLTAFLSLALTSAVFSDPEPHTLTLSAKQTVQASYRDLFEPRVLGHFQPFNFLELEPAGAAAFSVKDWESISYKLEAVSKPLSFIELRIRASHKLFLPLTVSSSHLLYLMRLKTPEFLGIQFFTGLGWYQRFMQLNKSSILFFPFRNSYTEHDFALELGVQIDLGKDYFARLRAATFEEIDVYNLNHPMGELSFGIPIDSSLYLHLLTRYQIGLGFGRLDNLVFGANLSLL